MRTGLDTEALPDHAQDGLQQSQYLVVVPVPLSASTLAASAKKEAGPTRSALERTTILVGEDAEGMIGSQLEEDARKECARGIKGRRVEVR